MVSRCPIVALALCWFDRRGYEIRLLRSRMLSLVSGILLYGGGR